jgi:hypothetical protein
MTLYGVLVCIHVVTAILGMGLVAGIAILATTANAQGPSCAGIWLALKRLSRTAGISLGVLILSGALLDFVSSGAYHRAWWFRLSVLLVIAIGAVNGRMFRALRKGESDGDDRTLERVIRSAWIMCGLVAVVAVLMEAKPW